ncbi:MAG: hypothetical protein QOE86_2675 [Solirubrobacteraceae bacterium]|nr:hypothetical protein [Solirubrobacteraceae bacterium]
MIEDPSAVDLVVARRDGTVVLSMFEERPWDGSEERLNQLQKKVNSYLSFVLDGHMAEQHPDIDAKQIQIILNYTGKMDSRTRELLPAIELTLAEYGIDFAIAHMREITAG